jgi:CHAT domain-containing protein
MRCLCKILILLFFCYVFCNNLFVSAEIIIPKENIKADSIQLLLNLANASINAGNYEKALSFAKEVHQLRLRKYLPNDPKIVISYLNLVYVYTMVSDYDSAQYFISKAEELYTSGQISEGPELCDLYSNMGLINRYMGDYLLAESCYLRAIEYYKKFSKNLNTEDFVLLYTRLASVESLLKKHEIALIYYNKCLKLLESMKNNTRDVLACYIGSASVYSELQDYEKSISLQIKAIKLTRSDSSNNALRLGILYSNIGNNYLKISRTNQAELYLQSALSQYRFLGYKGNNLAQTFENLGRLYEKQNNYSKALDIYQEALQNLSPGFKAKDNLSNPAKADLFPSPVLLTILKSKINCLNNYYKKNHDLSLLEAAINTSLLEVEIIEDMRNTYQSYESKLQVANDGNSIYKTTVELLKNAYKATGNMQYSQQAFVISEKSKSAILLSSLRDMDAQKFAGIPQSLLNEEKKLSRTISLYKENIHEEKQESNSDEDKIKNWEGYLFDAQQKHNKLIKKFETSYPRYFALKYNNSVLQVNELQKLIPGNTTLLEYSMDNSVLNIFSISRNSFVLQSIEIDSTFNKVLSAYISGFHNFDFSRQSYSDYTEFCWNSNSLYNILIKPVLKYIKGDNLIIVPDGSLSYLPFETLIKSMPKDMPATYYKALRYLLYDYNVSYAYSSTLYCQVNNEKKERQNNKLLAFAPEYSESFNPNDYLEEFVTRQKFRRELFPIPGVIDEVNGIKSLLPSDVYMGSEATESKFKEIVKNYDILHLAMHAVIDNSSPLYSKLVFSPSMDTLEDGLLNTHEIFGLQMNARMVVLSACNTGEGDYNNGEGVMSLARGFVYAGSPSLVMTMWEVEDKSGSTMMKRFYENLLNGQSKAEALRNAKISYLQNARPESIHPFFWSSFVVMGNTQPLFRKKSKILPLGIGISIGLLLVIFTFRIIRKLR